MDALQHCLQQKMEFVSASTTASTKSVNPISQLSPSHITATENNLELRQKEKSGLMAKMTRRRGNSGTGNRTLGSAELISQVMRARNVSHYTIPDGF